MKAISLGMFSAILLCWAQQAPARADTPAAALEIAKQFEDEIAAVEKKTEPELARCTERTIAELTKVQDALCKEAKLDEAVAVRNLIRAIKTSADVVLTEAVPAAAKEVYKQHEQDVMEVLKKADAQADKLRTKATTELKKLQDLFCKEAKLDEAIAIRDMIKSIREGISEVLPDPGYVRNTAADIGKVFRYEVTGAEAGGSIWGTDVYTSDSYLAMAAVHAGVLKNGQKGIVKVTILPGQDSYEGSTKNGVTSMPWGNWGVSFKVERVFRFGSRRPANVLPDPGTLAERRGDTGKVFYYEVTGSDTGNVWGTDTYTDDSTLAMATVHAGVLKNGQKGVVKVTMLPGQASYEGSTKNGVTTQGYGEWGGSYKVEAVR
jgi:hypothetical protein